MNKKIIILLIGIILITFVGYGSSGSCGGNGWSPPPQIPEEEEPEPTLGKVTLQWNPNTEPELAGYRIYYGLSSGFYLYYDQIWRETTHKVIDLEKDVYWYFAVTAYAISPVWAESDYSSEVSCIISD